MKQYFSRDRRGGAGRHGQDQGTGRADQGNGGGDWGRVRV